MASFWRFEEISQRTSFKDIELKQSEYLGERDTESGLELEKRQEQIDAQGNPELRQNGIG